MRQLNDTSPDAERVLVDVYRNMSIPEKWRRLGEIYRTARTLHATGVRYRNPTATPQEIQEDWLALTLDESLLKDFKEAVGGSER